MVSDVVLVAAIAAVPATIGAIVGMINRNKLHEVGERMNGRLDQILELTRAQGFAAGVKQETDKTEISGPGNG